MKHSGIVSSIAFVASLAGLGLTAFGLYDMQLAQVHASLLVLVLVAATVLGLMLRYGHLSVMWSTGLAAATLALATGTLWQWLVVVWFGVASMLMGRWLLGKLRVNAADWASQGLTGAGALGTVVGLAANFPIATAGTYGLLLAMPFVLNASYLRKAGTAVSKFALPQGATGFTRLSVTLDCLLGGVGLLYLAFALAPELGHDALATHLFIPGYLQSHGQWSFDAHTYVWAVMPMLGDWIYAVPYLLAGESAARLTNVGFIFVLALLVRDLARWAGASATGGRWAALIFLTTPLTFTEGSSLFIESIWSCFVVGGVFLVLKVCYEKPLAGERLILAGGLLGFALATKAVTLPLLPVVLLFLIWKQRHWLKSNEAPLQWQSGVLLFLLIGVVPYATAWWLTGNPIFPFFNAVFKSPLWELANFEATAFGKGVPWDVLYAVTFDSGRFLEARAGTGGFQWLLLFLPFALGLVVARDSKAAALMLYGLATVFLVFHSTAYLRYVFPAYALLASVVGVGFGGADAWPRMLSRWFAFLGFLTVFLGTTFLTSGAFHSDSAWRSLWGSQARAEFLVTRLPIRNAIPLVNALNVDKHAVAVLSEPFGAGLDAEALYVSWYNRDMQTAYFAAKTEAELAKVLVEQGVEFLIIDKGWSANGNVTTGQLALVPLVSDLVWQQGPVSVRKLKSTYRHRTEYLLNSNFDGPEHWNLPVPDMYDSATRSVRVSVGAPATQTIAVVAGRSYVNTVRARCIDKKTQGRIQVNWSDAKGKFIQPHIDVFDCTPDWADYTMLSTAPKGAVQATVFASGHTETPLAYQSVSFK